MAGYNRVRINAANVHAFFSSHGLDKGTTLQIRTKLNKLNEKINDIDLQEKYVKDFIAKAKEYINIEKLTPEILRAFIKRIDVYEKEVRYSRTCGNTIVIQYTFQLGKNLARKYPEGT